MNTVFDSTEKTVNLGIVYDKNNKKYAEMLRSFISQRTEIKAVIWSQKVYEDNTPVVSSRNYFLFLGDFPDQKAFMKQQNAGTEGANYGIYIGQCGRQSCIEIAPNMQYIKDHKQQYDKFCTDIKNKVISWSAIAISIALTSLIGVLAIPVGAGILINAHRKKMAKQQLSVAAVIEYYNNYLDNFLGVNNE